MKIIDNRILNNYLVIIYLIIIINRRSNMSNAGIELRNNLMHSYLAASRSTGLIKQMINTNNTMVTIIRMDKFYII